MGLLSEGRDPMMRVENPRSLLGAQTIKADPVKGRP